MYFKICILSEKSSINLTYLHNLKVGRYFLFLGLKISQLLPVPFLAHPAFHSWLFLFLFPLILPSLFPTLHLIASNVTSLNCFFICIRSLDSTFYFRFLLPSEIPLVFRNLLGFSCRISENSVRRISRERIFIFPVIFVVFDIHERELDAPEKNLSYRVNYGAEKCSNFTTNILLQLLWLHNVTDCAFFP